jgi:hypothetical protein
MNHPLEALQAALARSVEESEDHPLSPAAQADNLRAAFEHYTQPKAFRAGDLVQYRTGLNILRQTNVVLLFVRWLSPTDSFDDLLVADTVQRQKWNKVDCVLLRQNGESTMAFEPSDSDLLEPYEEGTEG